MKKEFRSIKDYENYLISTSGEVINSEKGFKTLTQHDNGKGYMGVGLSKNGKTTRFLVHRLVAQSFIPNPENKPCVNHIDENKSNNNLDNLEWATQSENVRHSLEDKYINSQPISQFNLKGELIAIWDSINDADYCGFNKSAIRKCCKEIESTYKGFKWRIGFDLMFANNSHFIDMRGVI